MRNDEKTLKSPRAHTVSRRKFVHGGSAVGAAAVAGLAAPSLAGAAQGRPMTVRVENATITLNVLPAPSATFFLVIGTITQVDGALAGGTYYCRGVFTETAALGLPNLAAGTPVPIPGLTFVEQRFRIDGEGTIVGSGDEGDHPLAIVGGTGRFTGAHGTYSPDAGLPIPVGAGVINFDFNIRRG